MGAIVGHGIDLVEVARIARMLDDHGERFAERCFGARERGYCDGAARRRAEHYAARFAAKEAVLKALGTGLRDGITWLDIEITREGGGRPGVELSGRAAEKAAALHIDAWHISLSHTEDFAIAGAIAESFEPAR